MTVEQSEDQGMLALGSNAASASASAWLYPWDCHVQSQLSHLERRQENCPPHWNA